MKRIKIKKSLCLLFVAVCSMLFTISPTAFAVHNEGSMEVIAHIETAPDEASQPDADGGESAAVPDKGNISTGEAVSVCVAVSLILLIISVLAIYICNRNDKSNGINSRK